MKGKCFHGIAVLLLGWVLIVSPRPAAAGAAARPGRAGVEKPPEDGGKKKKRRKKRRSRRGRKKKSKKGAHPFPKGDREKTFAEKLGEDYKRRYTDHFVVLYHADEEVVKNFIFRLEQSYKSVHRFSTKLGLKLSYPKEKLIVVFCPDYEEYNAQCEVFVRRKAPKVAAGLYWSAPANFSIFYDMSQNSVMKEFADKVRNLQDAARKATDRNTKKAKAKEAQWYQNRAKRYQQTNNRSVVQHEVAHQLLYNFQVHKPGARNPQWFVEGMATLFEPPPGRRGAGFNVINQRRLGAIRESIEKYTADELRTFIGAGAEHKGMLSNEGYARAWALVYYLVKRKHKQLPKYVESIKKRSRLKDMTPEEAVADFEKAFGKVDEKFVKQWAKYIRRLPFIPER